MNKNTLLKMIAVFVLVLTTQTVFGGDDPKYTIANVWEPGSYTLRQDCFISLITSVEKKVTSRDQTQVLFTWYADVSELQEGGIQKLILKASRVMLRFEANDSELAFFDSSNEGANDEFVNDLFRRFMSASIEVVIKNGKTESASVKDDVWKGIEPKNQDEKAFYERFQSLLTKENFEQIFDPFSWVANQEEVQLNDEWSNEIITSVQGVGDQSLRWNCKLDSIRKIGSSTFANVVANSNLEVKVQELLTADLKATIKVKFNAKTGSPTDLESRTTVSAVKTSENPEEPEMNITALQRNNLTVAKR
ncbi:MAG: hypothetical protein PHO46_03940 [Thermoguttaceae bacterium]|jgi:hypothetical protein|nr:hypothetical protein [Thermoguttaceae bacterium]